MRGRNVRRSLGQAKKSNQISKTLSVNNSPKSKESSLGLNGGRPRSMNRFGKGSQMKHTHQLFDLNKDNFLILSPNIQNPHQGKVNWGETK